MARKGLLILFLLFSVLYLSTAAEEENAPPSGLASLVPGDTHVLILFPSLKAAWEGFKSLPLYQAYQDEEVQVFIESFGEGLDELAPGINMRLIKELLTLPEVFDGEAAFAMQFPMERDDGDRWILSLHAMEDTEKAGAFVEKTLYPLLKAFFPWGPEKETVGGAEVTVFKGPLLSLYVINSEGHLVIAQSKEGLEDLLARKKESIGSLSENGSYRTAKAQWEKESPSFVLYTTLEGVWKNADEDMEKEDRAVLRATGFDGLQYLFVCLAMDGGRAEDLIHLNIPGEKRGFFRIFSNAPVDPDMVRIAPNNTLLFAGGNLEIGALYQTVLAMEKASPRGGLQDLRRSADDLAGKLGLRSFSDLMGLLGTEVLFYTALPQGGGGLIPEVVAALEVLEPDKLQTNLFGLVETLAGTPPKTMNFQNRRIHYLPFTRRDF